MVSVKSDANDTAPAANDTAPAAEDMERAVAIGEMPPAAANCNLLCLPWNLVCGYTTVNVREIQVAEYCGIVTAVRDEPGLYRQDVCGLSEKRVSTAVQVLDLPNAKVVDAGGAPVLVSAIVNYKVVDGLQALYNVENYGQFVFVNAQSVLKNIVGSRTYAELKTETASISLELERELQPVVDCAGVKIMSVALNELNYAPEIASSMLKKQAAGAMLEARQLIVQGAVQISQDAIVALEAGGKLKLSNDDKVRMVTNLLTVTCSDNDAQPTVSV
ncbi:hypothetical protein TeGR_g4527 [Tetraparma gracilis]|uniref:Band 7 domain-containing protein n=1 Tax=Tetraparma gracilis TaxID=2962635 RepID=A0ABQ6NDW2_9STRA|nr:hypothetical protein TeGR_g4527 [Tetraparma gracilis]